MKKFFMVLLMLLSFNVFADTLGGNVSTLQNSNGTYANIFEVYGSQAYSDNVDLVAKGVLKSNNVVDKHGVALEVGAKYKYLGISQLRLVPWVQPSLTYVNPIARDSYIGYVVDGGVDFYAAPDVAITPVVSYENSFAGRAVDEKYTYGLKGAYLVDNNNVVYLKVRRENGNFGQVDNRYYAGYEYKF